MQLGLSVSALSGLRTKGLAPPENDLHKTPVLEGTSMDELPNF